MIEEETEALAVELRQTLGSALLHAQKIGSGPCLAKTDSGQWLSIASDLLQAKSKTSLRKDKGGKYSAGSIETVLSQLEDFEGLDAVKTKLAVRAARKLNILDDIWVEAAMKLRDAIDDGDYVPTAKDLKELSVASQIENQIYLRSKGEATHIIEERKVTTEEIDTEKDKLRKRIEAAQAADVIDV